MDGIFINGKRPKSKKDIKDALLTAPHTVVIESTSMFGGFGGSALDMPEGIEIAFVGPDPYTRRSFYGTLSRKGMNVKVK